MLANFVTLDSNVISGCLSYDERQAEYFSLNTPDVCTFCEGIYLFSLSLIFCLATKLFIFHRELWETEENGFMEDVENDSLKEVGIAVDVAIFDELYVAEFKCRCSMT